ncbi:hypothetical protein [Micromonospora auratinigra]|uniref:Lipoprotein n=1 Tax=Micromonospora auratinigra TaxID=261654 RepID=A0A1A8Z9H9_9ACTN|nr:hypothetical protein [Micromonospora auratinigra]SBT40492.1 hypothetical protein GA0070611_1281 [Micromonospora auratinigra]
MRTIRLVLGGTALLAAMLVAGCDDGNDTANTAGTPAAAAATPQATSTATAGATGLPADAKETCTKLDADIKAALGRVAKATKIGPPAGHSAVSAQYSAGAAGMYVHTFTSSDAVNNAAKQVATAMTQLADAWAKNPKQKPSTAELDAAVTQVHTVCRAG